MRVEMSTADLPNRRRLHHLQEIHRHSPYRSEPRATGNEVHHHSVAYMAGGNALVTVRQQGIEFVREAADPVRISHVKFFLDVDGTSIATQGKRTTAARPGEIIMLDGDQPYSHSAIEQGATVNMLFVPKAALGTRTRLLEDCTAITFGTHDPVQRVAAEYWQSLLREMAAGLDNATAQMLIAQCVDLLLLTMERGKGHLRKTMPSSYKMALAKRIKHYVDANLRDRRLSLASTAAAIGISERYVNHLLAIDETSFGRYVLARRLEGCRDELRDPARLSTQIAEIAFDWGFVSNAHFSRAFRQRYGMSPTDYRQV